MSKQVHCPECQSENTPGSKFCNHCGARLPKSTSILCPRCQTPNPHSNFYCDNCGSRLKTEADGAPVEEEPTTSKTNDLPTSAKMFSLPTRDPGDTGELDTDNLPDWIKSQGEDSVEHESGKLPRLSDLTPEERGKKDDLPGWLIDTDSDDILKESPEDITTEHFLHLIQDINEEEREKLSGILNDPNVIEDSANLPDWLKGAAQPSENDIIEEDVSKDEADLFADDEPDWLFDLGDESEDEPEESLPASEEITPQDPDELPDWLTELGPPRTAMLGQTHEMDLDSLSLEQTDEEELADWLTEEPDTPESFDLDSEPDATLEEGVPDWMLEETPEEPNNEGVVEELSLDAAAETSLTGWLAEFDVEEGETETAVSDAETVIQEEAPQRSLTDWLSDFEEEEALEAAPDTSDEAASPDDTLLDFLTGGDIADETLTSATPEADDDLDWISAETASEESEENWLDSDIDSDVTLLSGNTGVLPDWLDELDSEEQAEPQTTSETSELDDTLADLFGEQPKDATGELEWLDEVESEAEGEDSSVSDLAGALGAAALVGAAASQQDEAEVDEDPDWLAELESFDADDLAEFDSDDLAEEEVFDVTSIPEQLSEELAEEPTAEIEFDVDDIIGATESAALDTFGIDDALLAEEKGSGDWVDIDGILSGEADDDTLPDWLEQLDDVIDTESIISTSDEAPPSEIPDWVANLRPDEDDQFASVLPSAFISGTDTDEFTGDPVELADADLPEWLGESISQKVTTEAKESAGWFEDGDYEDAPDELEALLADLPPAQAPEDMLQKAEIPDWLEELKPRELTGEAAPTQETRLESSGPLAGMPNTIAIEPIIAMPRATTTPANYTISPEQEQQARLLRQLTQEEPQPPATKKATLGVRRIFGLRILVAILLLAAIFVGLYGPTLLKSTIPAEVPVPATALNSAIEEAAGRSVLVAFEYTPALAGELDHEARMLLAKLAANGSLVMTSSQYVAGTAVATNLTTEYEVTELGFIPGEAMGLRQLSDCLGNAVDASCSSLHGLPLNKNQKDGLADVALIVVLTGERSSLVNWVEQVGSSTDIPIVVGATQALAPAVVPYYASAQVEGYLNGLPDTVAYQQTYLSSNENAQTSAQYGAQSLILLATAVIMLLGGLIISLSKRGS